ncbi:MAG: gamma-glutamyl-gamma-aminobutyrate hydrolase PuuD [Congregibacter sp.]|jgi:gamma-glutamyl-gamma-aminobutyrate hydrolase PuuD
MEHTPAGHLSRHIVGRDLDDLCQAIEATDNRQIVGVQWYPECLFYLPAQFTLFRRPLSSTLQGQARVLCQSLSD